MHFNSLESFYASALFFWNRLPFTHSILDGLIFDLHSTRSSSQLKLKLSLQLLFKKKKVSFLPAYSLSQHKCCGLNDSAFWPQHKRVLPLSAHKIFKFFWNAAHRHTSMPLIRNVLLPIIVHKQKPKKLTVFCLFKHFNKFWQQCTERALCS